METLVGFAFGFLLGTREGRDGLNRIKESWTAIRESADFNHLLGEAAVAMSPIVREVARATGGGRA